MADEEEERTDYSDGGPMYKAPDSKMDDDAKTVDFKYAEKLGAGLRKQSGQKRTNKRKVRAPSVGRKRGAAVKR